MHPLSRHTGTLITALLAVLTLMLNLPPEMGVKSSAAAPIAPVLGAMKIGE